MKKTYIFGASKYGFFAYEKIKRIHKITAFIDNDNEKKGRIYYGLKVLGLEDVDVVSSEIIIASQYTVEIARQLYHKGVKRFRVFYYKEGKDDGEDFDVLSYDFSCVDREAYSEKIFLFSRNNSGSNTRCLYNFAKEKNLDGIDNFVLVNEKDKGDSLYPLVFAKNVVTTHETPIFSGNNNIQLWHGFPLKGLNYMSRYQNKKTQDLTHENWKKYSLVTSYSKTYSTALGSCYGIPVSKFKITGMPRNDYLFERADFLNGRQGVKKILFMPTFRSTKFGQLNGDDLNEFLNLPIECLDRFKSFLDKNNIDLYVKLHPYQKKDPVQRTRLADLFEFIDDDFLEANGVDLYEIIGGFDCLITDYSSVYFDFLLLGKPVLFTPIDASKYDETRGFLFEPYEFWAPGPICINQSSLEYNISKLLDDEFYYAKDRELVRSLVHHYRDGESSKRTLVEILKLVGLF